MHELKAGLKAKKFAPEWPTPQSNIYDGASCG